MPKWVVYCCFAHIKHAMLLISIKSLFLIHSLRTLADLPQTIQRCQGATRLALEKLETLRIRQLDNLTLLTFKPHEPITLG